MEESQTDSALMELVAAGETAQVAILFERHHVALYRYLLHLTNNRTVSEDLVQEVFFRVIKHSRRYDSRHGFSVWIFSMARNAYFDIYRRRSREAPEEYLDSIRSREPLADELMSRSQDIGFLQEALQGLPQEKREVLILSRFHNLGYEEISAMLGCQVGTVKTRVFRALQELRKNFCELRKEKVYDV